MEKKFVKLVDNKIKINYCAVVLTEESRQKLLKEVTPLFDDVIAHHMSINMGPLSDTDKNSIGKIVNLKVVSESNDDKVQAVGVIQIDGPFTKNIYPHITISVNRTKGGKPFLSNKLVNWKGIKNFILQGTVQEL